MAGAEIRRRELTPCPEPVRVRWFDEPAARTGSVPESSAMCRRPVGRYRIDVDFYRYSDRTSGHTMPTSYRVVVTARNGQRYPCRSGVLGAPGDRVVACFVDVDDAGRVTSPP